MTQSTLVTQSKSHKLLYLLLCLLALILSSFFVPSNFVGLTIVDTLFSLVLVSLISIFRHQRTVIIITLILAVPMLTLRWLLHLDSVSWMSIASYTFGTALFVFISINLIRMILEEVRVSFDTIYGSISVYLLFGLAFAFLFAILCFFYPGSLVYQNGKVVTLDSDMLQAMKTLIYFSFTTLTTLGFGDISPVSAPVRIIAALEAVVGQIYLMVLVARLVGLHIAHHQIRK